MDLNLELDFPSDAPITTTITEGYLEAAYAFLAQDQLPAFHYPHSDSFYVKAAVRERFPESFAPSVVSLEDMLIADGMMPKRALKPGLALLPSPLLWPPRTRKGAVPKSLLIEDNDAPPF